MRVETLSSASTTRDGHDERDPIEACARAARGALSTNTEPAMRSDLAIYAAWCGERGVPALPARAETIAAFVDAMAKLRAPATVRRYVASIAAAHRALGLGKTAGSEIVRRALQRMHRRKGRRQEQAEGLTGALRERLLEVPGDGLIDARNRALLAVAYDTLLRRGELVALQVTDIVEELDGAATVLVRRSKTDPEGRGATVYLASDSLALVREWLARSGVRRGRVFRSLCRGALGEGLDASQVPRIFKSMAERGRIACRGRLTHLRAQHPGRCGAGHGRGRHRHGGHPARGSMEDVCDGQPLRRASPCAAKRRGAARPSSASRVGARRRIGRRHQLSSAGVRPPESVQGAVSHRMVIASPCGRPPGRRRLAAPGDGGLRASKHPLNQMVALRYGATRMSGI